MRPLSHDRGSSTSGDDERTTRIVHRASDARIGFLGLYSPQSYAPLLDAFLQALAELRWRDRIEVRIEGFVASLARPGGNITGVSSQVVELAPKRGSAFRSRCSCVPTW